MLTTFICIKSMYQNHINHGNHGSNMLTQTADKIGCMRTSFACGFTSIERRTIFDLWQKSYAPRSSLRSLRYASQTHISESVFESFESILLRSFSGAFLLMCTQVIVSLAWMFFRVPQKCDTRCDTRSHFSPKLVKAKMITFYN